MQRMQQVEFDSAMVDERDDAINDIASSILEVNETMRDLANIVEEQGKDIDQVEVNVTSAEDATEKGVGFLTDAEKYQKGCVRVRVRARARARLRLPRSGR
jgi:syntaxin 7